MLISNKEMLEDDPILSLIASMNKNSVQGIELQPGIYEIGHFGSSSSLRSFNHYPEFEKLKEDEYRGCYGVCDSVENLLAVFPELEASEREFVVRLTPVLKENQSASGGWRWHKWGDYIGSQEPECEYLYDEPKIEKVYCYHIYER